ncbi:Phox-like protein [Hortaea werneckii]|uniref:PX domain-containing protein n=1 Tax=Hortaea werneckii TaxID=91943 RepID=A0A3M7G900_HORWE|nr:Phox-like protein [Hortaea werneckii]KAI6867172.1 Phox-like protein [Hortaea werneckii]KAI7351025.1 Phox-like protein [Hortaea werneckii]KAI7563267.1 Phox-like protein [Hortaea werneckii]KAI7613616.1 Phox-like protein [Hortaea werneckii]
MAPALAISIPSASTATPAESKPFTQYHVVLQLPLRKHEIKKRYTDFTNLHDALVSQTNQAPPAPLPPKSWLRRTVNNESLTEERRQGLEKYLKSIVEADDARWRSSSAWRSFLNLPSGTSTLSSNGSLVGGSTSGKQQQGIADPNQWLDVHRDLKTQIQTARQQLKQREAAMTAQQQHSLAAEAKASLVRAATSIAQLDDGLRRISSASQGDEAGWGGSSKLGEGEIRRRRDLLGAARKEVEGLEGVLRSQASKSAAGTSSSGAAASPQTAGAVASTGDKDALWRGTSAGQKPKGRVLGGPLKETERTRELDNTGLLQQQQQIMEEQEEDVLTLGKTVAKLKDMGILIHEELEVQNAMLGMVEEDAGRVQGKIDVARSRIKKIR